MTWEAASAILLLGTSLVTIKLAKEFDPVREQEKKIQQARSQKEKEMIKKEGRHWKWFVHWILILVILAQMPMLAMFAWIMARANTSNVQYLSLSQFFFLVMFFPVMFFIVYIFFASFIKILKFGWELFTYDPSKQRDFEEQS